MSVNVAGVADARVEISQVRVQGFFTGAHQQRGWVGSGGAHEHARLSCRTRRSVVPGALAEIAALQVDCSTYSARALAIYSSSASLTIALILPAPPRIRSIFQQSSA